MERVDVLVVGAGLAGLSCAQRLAAAGRQVLVLESGDVLGGRTSSWIDDGMPIDSGLHKFLGIYRELPDLLHQVGLDTDDVVIWVDEVGLHVPDGPSAVFTTAPVHRPLGTILTALENNDYLPPGEKLKLLPFGAAGVAEATGEPEELDRTDIATYARRHDLAELTISRVLEPLTTGVFFLPPNEYSAYATFAPVVEGLKRVTFRVGGFRGGMTEVLIEPVARYLRTRDAEARVHSAVERLLVEDGRVVGVELGGRTIRAKEVVLATNLHVAQTLLRPALAGHPWLHGMLSLPTVSTVVVEMDLDRPSIETDRVNFSAGPLACFGEQCRTTFTHVPGRLSVILYPGERFLPLDNRAIFELVVSEAARLGIDLVDQVRQYRVVRHANEFYAMRPGTEPRRPAQATPIEGLTLAGDYTRQPFLASMEGATIAGRRAADALLGAGSAP